MMRIIEVWFPGPSGRPVYSLPQRPRIPRVEAWDRLDIQVRVPSAYPPQYPILGTNPVGWSSFVFQHASLVNGYPRLGATHEEFLAQCLKYDLVIIHWKHPFQIAWSLYTAGRLRQRPQRPRVALWGRHTSYGRDVSRDLKALAHHALLARLFDAIICTADEAGPRGLLEYFTTRDPGVLFETLIAQDGRFVFHSSPRPPRQSDPPAIPGGSDLSPPAPIWCGDGLPEHLPQEQAWINWQAAGPVELDAGMTRLKQWRNEGKTLRITMPFAYPWFSPVQERQFRLWCREIGAAEAPYHDYQLEPTYDLPDRCPCPA